MSVFSGVYARVNLTENQRSTISDFVANGRYPEAYRYASEIVKNTPYADQRVANWLDNAAAINADDGSFKSNYVRAATLEAINDLGSQSSNEMFQIVSDELAVTVLNGFVNNSNIPNLKTIIQEDVKAAVEGYGLTPEGWAGTLGAMLSINWGGLDLEWEELYPELIDELNIRGVDSFFEWAGAFFDVFENNVWGLAAGLGWEGWKGDATSWGDPHLITFDGLSYDFQDRGEYTLVESTDSQLPFEVQVRHEEWTGNHRGASVNTAVAVDVDGHKVNIYADAITSGVSENGDYMQAQGNEGGLSLLGGNDVAYGSALADTLSGDTGDDMLVGNGGADVLDGGAGQDVLVGGAGDDTLIDSGSDASVDRAYFTGNFSDYTVQTAAHTEGATVFDRVTDTVGSDGNDLVDQNIEEMVFADGVYSGGTFTPFYTLENDGQIINEVTNEDFETTPTGWSNNTWTDPAPNTAVDTHLTSFLGRFGGTQLTEKTFNLSGNQQAITIEFDFYRLDSWDHPETFNISLDGNYTVSDSAANMVYSPITSSSGNFALGEWSWTKEVTAQNVYSGWSDSIHSFSITYNTIDTDFTLRLQATLNQGLGDESWGVDNVVIRELATPVGVPEAYRLPDVSEAPTLFVDGTPTFIEDNEALSVGGGLVYRQGNSHTVMTQYGDGIQVDDKGSYLNVSPFLSSVREDGSIQGLLGNNDNNPDNDFTTSEGTTYGRNIAASDLYLNFGESYRVTQSESLFTYRAGENFGDFDDPNFQVRYQTLNDFDPVVVEQARQQAISQGFDQHSPIFDAVVFDIVAGLEPQLDSNLATLETQTNIVVADVVDDFTSVFGTAANDTLNGTSADESLFGLAGNDALYGEGGADVLDGGSGSDTAYYANSTTGVTVSLVNNAANTGDALGDSYISIENLVGSHYDDALYGDANNNTISGRFGNDSLYGNGSNDLLLGGDGNDMLNGGSGDDILDGGSGDDTLLGQEGADTLVGGSGIDTAHYASSSAALAIDLASGTGLGGDAEGDSLSGIENVIGSSYHDELTGDSNDNQFIAGAGDDFIIGGAGDDLIYAGDGNDILIGGLGADILSGSSGLDSFRYETIAESTNASRDRIDGFTQGQNTIDVSRIGITSLSDLTMSQSSGSTIVSSTINDFEVQLTGLYTLDANDFVFDTVQQVEINGTSGNDDLLGTTNDDTINGLEGNDMLEGGAGADVLNGGLGLDTATYATSSTGVTVSLLNPLLNTGDAVGDSYISIENLVGTYYDDFLYGDATNNTISGRSGNDRIYGNGLKDLLLGGDDDDIISGGGDDDRLFGGAGDDTLTGESGADELVGESGVDIATYWASAEGITIDLVNGTGVGGDAQGDTLSGIENIGATNFDDTLTGDALDNSFFAGAGNDTLYGGAGVDRFYASDGDDLLVGQAGGDILIGGSGADTFLYEQVTDSNATTRDDIRDFEQSIDKIDLAILGISSISDLTITHIDDNTVISANSSDFQVKLTGHYTLTESDFIFAQHNGLTVIGTSGNDYLVGSDLDDVIHGLDGNDTLLAYGGDDQLYGGAGNDFLNPSTGADFIDGGEGFDTVTYLGIDPQWGAHVDLITGDHQGFYSQGDTIINVERIETGFWDDTVIGDHNDNDIFLSSGNDYAEGNGGNDTLRGSLGNDQLFGDGGDDILDGGEDNDLLVGGSGADQMSGRFGADIFRFDAANDSTALARDLITDFSQTDGDLIDVSALGFTSLADFTISNTGGNTIISANNNDFELELQGTVALASSDFTWS